ncbi:MAG TPA: glycoside hydrolase family 2 protein [Capsulimonadaceae bacterium]|nr:glycoside hydrolase family 2 protein [Capsulimonadaceae bacterium]
MQVTHRLIDTGWRVREIPREGASPTTELRWLPAQVPGQVHLDLERAGVIPDPFYRMFERDAAWVDECDWMYETTFQVAEPPAHAYLLFHGLDTLAEIELNDKPLGKTQNMFVPHEFAVGGRLRAGDNTLRITFRSAMRIGYERQKAWNAAGNDTAKFHWFNWGPRCFVRKAQYMYGWDWGPELVSCGIWQPVELVTAPVARLLDWKYNVDFTGDGKAVVNVEADIERAPGAENQPLSFHLNLRGVRSNSEQSLNVVDVPTGKNHVTAQATLTVEKPLRWWPRMQKSLSEEVDSALYGLEMVVVAGDKAVAEREAHIGLRTVELIQEDDPDGKGRGFKFRINGEDVFMKGANWIPADSFPSRLHEEGEYRERMERLLRTVADAGYNMLRVWGGGLYESEDFYNLCDKLGILVWQDFPYACAYYPDTGEYAEESQREAIAAARRIRNHASLALWCGNNENSMMFQGNWTGDRPGRLLGEHIYNEVLPAVLKVEDPQTPYIFSSPSGGEDVNSADYGDRHNWDVWHGVGDWIHYAQDRSRFCSEFGFASSCGMATWDTCLAPADKWPNSPAVQWHDKTRKGYETYFGLFTLHHAVPQTLEDLVYYTQINQAEALKHGVEHYRRNKGRCWGTLIWQINDCWPVQSWAMVDYLGVPKAGFYASRRFYAPVLLSLFKAEVENSAEVHLVNDLLTPIEGTAIVVVESFEGEVLAKKEFAGSVEANGTALIGKMDLSAANGKERESYVYAEFRSKDGGNKLTGDAHLFLAEPKDLELPNAGVSFTLREDGGTCVLSLQAKRFAPYVWIEVEQEKATEQIELSDNFFHIRPNETKEVSLSRPAGVRLNDVLGRIHLRTL